VALRLGADMPALPGCTPFLHRLQHFPRRHRHPLCIHMRAWRRGRVESIGDHGLKRIGSAESLRGLGTPGGALLGQGARFVLGLAGLQGGLLCQLQRLHRCRRPTMITLKMTCQLPLPVLDQHPPAGPPLIQSWVNPDDLPHKPLTRIRVRPIRKPHPQPVAEMLFQGGVVGLRCGHGGFEQHPSVDGQPAAAEGLDLVRHRHMSV
jgi:hypothetical protein